MVNADSRSSRGTRRYWKKVSDRDRTTTLEFMERPDVEIRNWYRTLGALQASPRYDQRRKAESGTYSHTCSTGQDPANATNPVRRTEAAAVETPANNGNPNGTLVPA